MENRLPSFRTVFLLSILLMCAVAVWCQDVETIVTTDEKGVRRTISHARVWFANDCGSGDPDAVSGEHGFRVVTRNLPPRADAWVHFSQIRVASFQRVLGDIKTIKASLQLDDGQRVDGILNRASAMRLGTRDAAIALSPDQIRSVEFPEFSWFAETKNDPQARQVADRRAAAARWQRRRADRVRDNGGSLSWSITDGEGTSLVKELSFWFTYRTNQCGAYEYFDRAFSGWTSRSTADLPGVGSINVGQASLSYPHGLFSSVEFTGRVINGMPEVDVAETNGTHLKGPLAVNEHMPGIEEMLVWEVPYGNQATALLPARRILIKLKR